MIQRLSHVLRAIVRLPRRRRNEPSPDRETLMTLDEVAARLGVDVRVVRRAIVTGDIQAVRTGKDLMIERSAFERSLAIASAHYGPGS